MSVDAILKERGKQHGDFAVNARVSQDLKKVVRGSLPTNHLTPSQSEAIDMILHKISRIVAGDPNHIDHWVDISGYATLIVNQLRASLVEHK